MPNVDGLLLQQNMYQQYTSPRVNMECMNECVCLSNLLTFMCDVKISRYKISDHVHVHVQAMLPHGTMQYAVMHGNLTRARV